MVEEREQEGRRVIAAVTDLNQISSFFSFFHFFTSP